MSNFLVVSLSQLLRGNVAERQLQCDTRHLKETINVINKMRFSPNTPHEFACIPTTKGVTHTNFTLCLITFNQPPPHTHTLPLPLEGLKLGA